MTKHAALKIIGARLVAAGHSLKTPSWQTLKAAVLGTAHNTGSPNCACPWVKPCDFYRDGGVCGYSLPNKTGALRAGA